MSARQSHRRASTGCRIATQLGSRQGGPTSQNSDPGDVGTAISQAGPANSDTMLLHCLFAMVFAAAVLGVLSCLGVVAGSGNKCGAGELYTRCEAWQDFRSLLSFVLGALMCPLLTPRCGRPGGEGGGGKSHFHACLL
mmetsp:Transcript_78674/g.205174  ORF Transcript_78674/g.205174 Transcript_78674/m.205174 type:complete len:138 (+) Transcript_78674:155-568(+)